MTKDAPDMCRTMWLRRPRALATTPVARTLTTPVACAKPVQCTQRVHTPMVEPTPSACATNLMKASSVKTLAMLSLTT